MLTCAARYAQCIAGWAFPYTDTAVLKTCPALQSGSLEVGQGPQQPNCCLDRQIGLLPAHGQVAGATDA